MALAACAATGAALGEKGSSARPSVGGTDTFAQVAAQEWTADQPRVGRLESSGGQLKFSSVLTMCP
jgi:hypothetical protein